MSVWHHYKKDEKNMSFSIKKLSLIVLSSLLGSVATAQNYIQNAYNPFEDKVSVDKRAAEIKTYTTGGKDCVKPNATEYKIYSTALKLGDPQISRKMSNYFCFDVNIFNYGAIGENHPLFDVLDTDVFSYILSKTKYPFIYKEKDTGADLLTSLMVEPYVNRSRGEKADMQERNRALNILYAYDKTIDAKILKSKYAKNPYYYSPEKEPRFNNTMLAKLNDNIAKVVKSYDQVVRLIKNKHNADATDCSIVTKNNYVFDRLINRSYYNPFKKVDYQLTPIHLLFSPLNPTYKAKNHFDLDSWGRDTSSNGMEGILLENFGTDNIRKLDIKDGLHFDEFVELMKDNNRVAYNIIMDKLTRMRYQPPEEIKTRLNALMNNKDAIKTNKDLYDKTILSICDIPGPTNDK